MLLKHLSYTRLRKQERRGRREESERKKRAGEVLSVLQKLGRAFFFRAPVSAKIFLMPR